RLAALMEAPMADEVLQDDARFLETLYAWGGERTCEAALLLGARKPSLADISLRRAREALAWQRPAFPLRGADILALGIAPGPTGRPALPASRSGCGSSPAPDGALHPKPKFLKFFGFAAQPPGRAMA